MKGINLGFILLSLLGTSCTDSDLNLKKDIALIYEHDYPYAQDFLGYAYTDENKLKTIFLVSETSERKRMSFEYSINEPDKVSKVYYDNGDSPTITYDSLIFSDDQLIEIINKSVRNDTVLSTTINSFNYNTQGQLIKITSKWNEHPSNCIKEIEFSNYINNQFTRVDYKWCSQLELVTKLGHDNNVSPFALMDKNIKLILLTHFGGTAFNFVTESNIIKVDTEVHNQPTLMTNSYKINYKLDSSGQPISSVMTDVTTSDYDWTNFYRYK